VSRLALAVQQGGGFDIATTLAGGGVGGGFEQMNRPEVVNEREKQGEREMEEWVGELIDVDGNGQ
jgi:hypothetical protein